jgi:hypothetical protein
LVHTLAWKWTTPRRTASLTVTAVSTVASPRDEDAVAVGDVTDSRVGKVDGE